MPELPSAVEGVELTGGVQVDIPADPGYVSLVRMIVSSLAYGCPDLSEERVEDLVLAVSEACSNAIEAHGDAGHPVVLRWEQDEERCVAEVVDRGGGMDLAALPPEGAPADPGRAALAGDLSIPLIRALVDEVQFDTDDRGTAVRMTVYCGDRPPPSGDD